MFSLPSLSDLAKKHGTDKCSPGSHTFFNKNYLDIYARYIEVIRNQPIRFLEIGVLNGKSLAMWREYFPNAEIHGIDIEPECKKYEDKVAKKFVHILDCSDDVALNEFKQKFTGYFDVILDDGSHINVITKKTFDYLYFCLKSEGIYMIEDLSCAYLGNEFKDHVPYWPGTQLIKNKVSTNDPQILLNLYSEIHRLVDAPSTDLAKIGLDPTYEKFGFEYIHHYPAIVIMKKNETYVGVESYNTRIHKKVKEPKLHLLMFADNHLSQYGLNSYTKKVERIAGQAGDFSLFSQIHVYTAQSLFEKFPEFLVKHKDFIESNFNRNNWKGYGYWIWKPFIIWKTLLEIDEGDILLYADSGCELHISGKDRFMEYLNMVRTNPHGNLFFSHPDLIKNWCKMDTVKHFDAEKIVLENDSKQTVAGMLFTTNTEFNRNFFKTYYENCCNYHIIDDSTSLTPNISTFKEHRHDMSIFSILVQKMFPLSVSSVPYIEIYHPDTMKDPAFAKYPMTIQSNQA